MIPRPPTSTPTDTLFPSPTLCRSASGHYLLGNYGESLADIAETLALEPRHFGALSGRGLVYLRLEDAQRALDAFEQALAIHPNLPAAAINAEELRKMLHDREI